LKEFFGIGDIRKPLRKLCLKQFLRFIRAENGDDFKRRFCLKSINLTLAVDDQAYRDGLYPARGKGRLYLFPQYRGQLKTHKPVEHPSRLLCVDQVKIDSPWGFNRA